MSRHDEDIDGKPYLTEHGKYAAQFARNHNIPISEAYEHKTVKAHKDMLEHLGQCHDFFSGTMKGDSNERTI